MRARVPLLLGLALVAFLGWVLGSDGEGRPGTLGPADPEPGAPADPHLLRASGGGREPAAGPQLRAPARSAAASRARGPVRVRVEGPDGAPVYGAFVQLRRGAGPDGVEGRSVDATGEAAFADVPYDGSARLLFYRADPVIDERNTVHRPLPPLGGGRHERSVTGATLRYRAASGLWLDVEVVEAETGRVLPDTRVRLGLWHDTSDGWIAAPGPLRVTAPVDGKARVSYEVADVPGRARPLGPPLSPHVVSPYARRLRAVQPLRAEQRVVVLGVDEEGRAKPLVIHRVAFDAWPVSGWQAVPDAFDRMVLTGVPFLRGERLTVWGGPTQGPLADCTEPSSVFLPAQPAAEVQVRIVLPDVLIEESEELEEEMGIGGIRSGQHRWRRPSTPPDTKVHVRVLRRDGSPAVGAAVDAGVGGLAHTAARTDLQGRVTLRGVPPGARTITVRQIGLLPIEATVEVREGAPTHAVLREPAGGSLDICVLDPDKNPLPAARLQVATPSGLPWIDMHGTTQRIDPYTDHRGRRRLRDLEAGTHRVSVRWGSRSTTKTVVVTAGSVQPVEIVLPPRGVR